MFNLKDILGESYSGLFDELISKASAKRVIKDYSLDNYIYLFIDYYSNARTYSLNKCSPKHLCYVQAISLCSGDHYYEAYLLLKELDQYKDSYNYLKKCKDKLDEIYNRGMNLFNESKFPEAKIIFESIKLYLNCSALIDQCNTKISEMMAIRERERLAEETRRREAERVAREEADRRRRAEESARLERERRSREAAEKRGKAIKALQYIIVLLPPILVIVFGVILFTNKNQVEITSNYAGWVTLWVFGLLISVISSIIISVKKKNWDHDEKPSIITTIVMASFTALILLISIPNAAKLKPNFNPAKDIVISLRYKTNNDSYYSYSSEIGFLLRNTGKLKVTYLEWDAIFYNGNEQVGWYTIWHNGLIPPGESLNTYVQLNEQSPANIYNTSYSNLRVRIRVEKLGFNNGSKQYTYKGETYFASKIS